MKDERELKPGIGPVMFGPVGLGAAQHTPPESAVSPLSWGTFVKMLILRHEAKFVAWLACLVVFMLLLGSYLFMNRWHSQECIEALKTSQNGTVIMSLCR